MNRVLQLPLGASAPPVVESYTLGDVLICKANRGKLLEVEHLVQTLHADVNYRNQARPGGSVGPVRVPYGTWTCQLYSEANGSLACLLVCPP